MLRTMAVLASIHASDEAVGSVSTEGWPGHSLLFCSGVPAVTAGSCITAAGVIMVFS